MDKREPDMVMVPRTGERLSFRTVHLVRPGDVLKARETFTNPDVLTTGDHVIVESVSDGGNIVFTNLYRPTIQCGLSPDRFEFVSRPVTRLSAVYAAPTPEGGEPVDETQGILNTAHKMAARMGAELVVDPAKVAAFRAAQRDFAPAPKAEAASEASLWQAHDRREAYLRENLDVVLRAVEDMAKVGIEVAKQNPDYQTEDRDRARIAFIREVCERWAAPSEGGDEPVAWLQLIYELEHPDECRVGWQDNADLMREAARELRRLYAHPSPGPAVDRGGLCGKGWRTCSKAWTTRRPTAACFCPPRSALNTPTTSARCSPPSAPMLGVRDGRRHLIPSRLRMASDPNGGRPVGLAAPVSVDQQRQAEAAVCPRSLP